MNPVVLIPARLASTRLPRKPLADIYGEPMIVHVLKRARSANIGPVYVACAEQEIADVVIAAGGKAVITDPDLPSGSDRVNAAVDLIDPEARYDWVINLQGDMAVFDPSLLHNLVSGLSEQADIVTAAVETSAPQDKDNPNIVKVVMTPRGRALYFSRAAIAYGTGPVFHHIGVYAYRRSALNRFCALPPSDLERRERLEQLRALEAGMRIDVVVIDNAPYSVDTPEDLQRVKDLLKNSL